MDRGTASPRPAQHTMAGIALVLLSLCVLSALDAGGKWLMAAGLPLVILSWFRYAIHLVLALAVIVPSRGWGILRSQRPREQVLRGSAMLAATLCFFTALHYLPQAEATAINFLAPLLVLALAPWVLREPARLSRWVAAAIGFGGVLIVIRPGGGLHPVGTAFGLLGACCFAAQYLATRRVAGDDPLTSIIWSGAMGAIALTFALPFALAGSLPLLRDFTVVQWLVLVSTGITGCLGHLLQLAGYRRAPASAVAPFTYLQIASATAAGWLVWGQFPDPMTWVGIAIVCGSGIGIGAIEWRRSRAQNAGAVRAVSARRHSATD